MVNKNENKNREMGDKIIVIDCYDGAQHTSLSKNKVNVVSYSSQMFTKDMVDEGYSPAGSLDILTWQQVAGPEK